MRRVWPLVLAACSGSSSEPQQQAAPPATESPVAVSIAPSGELPAFGAPVAPTVAMPPRTTQLWHARHGVPIAAVFATEDGGAVVSIDEANHARLWPSLDGAREPFVLPFAMATIAAIARDGDGFAIAALDDSDGLELVTVTSSGVLTSHVKAGPEPGFSALIANDAGFLVLRRDQTLEQRDRRGEITGTLAPPSGEHVIELLHRNGRTLALVRTREGARGHWLATDRLAWGDTTPKLVIDPKRAFLSPDHTRLVSFRDSQGHAILVDLESGRARALASPNRDDGSKGSLGLPIGFTGDQRVVFAFDDFELSTFEWWTAGGRETAVLGGSRFELELVAVRDAVVTDRNVIAFSGHELAIATPNTVRSPSEIRFLGYRIDRARAVRSSPLGVVATIGGRATLLDDHVRVEQRSPAAEAVPFAKDLALVKYSAPESARGRDVSNAIDPDWLEGSAATPRHQVRPRIALYDLDAKQELQRWPAAQAFRFEAATQLLAFERGGRAELARFDPSARTFGAARRFATPVTAVQLLDPALADRHIAALAHVRGKTTEIRMIRDLDAELPAPMTLTGTLEAIDRAGRIYLREDADTIAVHAGARQPLRIPGMTGWSVRPSPAGTRLAAFAKGRLVMLDDGGRSVWSLGLPGIADVAWDPGGELIVLAGDLAKLDAATGRVTAAQCGWGFALRGSRPEPAEVPSTSATLCDR